MEPKIDPYATFYQRLSVLRDDFHRIGKFDDANAKLDELCKLFVLKVIDQQFPLPCGRPRLSLAYLSELANQQLGDASRLAGALHAVFDEMQAQDQRRFAVFGSQPRLGIDPQDDEFAQALLPVVESLPVSDGNDRWSFDLLNEAFGHFVQDSFRHRKEDAQYLTPPEVIAAMVDIGLHDLQQDQPSNPSEQKPTARRFLVADPTCGVGSFLAAAYCHAGHLTFHGQPLAERLEFFGQDKIERMVRMASVNLQLFTDAHTTIRQGNSVSPPALDDVTAAVDLLLTNPPFGASFETTKLFGAAVDARRFPILAEIERRQPLPARIDSEYLLFDRSLSLLRNGGRMLIVVPDKVVAADGFAATFRAATRKFAELLAVIDLPAETFAQAGTRTRTSVVYLRRKPSPATISTASVLMATVDELGFRVTSRAGASVKKHTGTNQLKRVVDVYQQLDSRTAPSDFGLVNCEVLRTDASRTVACTLAPSGRRQGDGLVNLSVFDAAVLNENPSVSLVTRSALMNGRWNARYYRADRIRALSAIGDLDADQFDVRQLAEWVEIDPDQNLRVDGSDGSAMISVLHVREDGFLDVGAIEAYHPLSGGVRCRPGDVLISRINPRIVRICVVPEFGRSVACSPEFAVLRCRDRMDPWTLALVMRHDLVQHQIQTLTSGTSSSHSRIKARELASIRLPIPRPDYPPFDRISRAASEYRELLGQYYRAVRRTLACIEVVDGDFTQTVPSTETIQGDV